MSETPSNSTNLDQLDEQLVAYLDGELEPQVSRQIENLLASDEYARRRLNQLASSWDLLDQLPRSTVDDLFTRTTVEMVALAAEDEVVQAQAADPARRRRRWLETGIAVAAAGLVGFVIIAITAPDENAGLLRDLSVVKNLELYRDVGNLELLKQFQNAKMFTDDNSAAPPGPSAGWRQTSSTSSATNFQSPIPAALDGRRAWVEELNPADKLELRDEYEKFSAMSVKQQQALRQFDLQLSNDADHDQLRRIMVHYYDWLKTLTTADRANLLDETNPPDQIKLIKQLRQGQLGQAFTWLEPGLNLLRDRDSAAVLQWMHDFAENHEADLTSEASEKQKSEGQPPEDRRRRRPLAMLAWQQWWGPNATGTPPVTSTDIHALHALLSPERQKQLDAEPGLNEQVQLVRQWVQKASGEFRELAVQGFGRWGGLPNPDRLRRFEEQQLSADEKKELEGLSSVDRMRKLMELYQKHRMADFQRSGGSGSGRQAESATNSGEGKKDQQPKSD
jgi:hypothetical protein